mgnify:FL=1
MICRLRKGMVISMKKERIIIARDFCITQMNHWVLYTIIMTALGICGVPSPSLWFWALLSLVPFVMFLARRYFDAFWQILVSHGAVLGLTFLLPAPDQVQKIVSLVLVAGYVMYSLYLRLHVSEMADTFVGESSISISQSPEPIPVKDGDRMDRKLNPWIALLLSVAAMSLRHYQGQISLGDEMLEGLGAASKLTAQVNLDRYYIGAVVLFFGLYCLEYYMEHYLYFLQVNDSSTGHMPAGEIFRSGMGLTCIYTGVGVVVMLLVSHMEWLAGAGAYVKRFLQWLFSFLPQSETTIAEEETREQVQENVNMLEQLGLEEGKRSIIWVVLEGIVMIAGAIALVVLVVWVSYRLFCYLKEKFSIRAHVDQRTMEAVVDVRESCAIEKTKKEKRPLWEILTNAGRIRRIYKKEVLKSLPSPNAGGRLLDRKITREGIQAMTPSEWGQAADKEALAAVYEKVRYSNEECTAEDVRIARS